MYFYYIAIFKIVFFFFSLSPYFKYLPFFFITESYKFLFRQFDTRSMCDFNNILVKI